MTPLVDRFGREITDLRISVTARCNFSCHYCHNEGQGPVRRVADAAEELTAAEMANIARVAASLGVRSIKLSGGEPLVRSDLEAIVEGCAEHAEVSMVCNGSLLARRAKSLRRAGLSRLNVSVDSLNATVFRDVGRGSVGTVLEGVHAALEAGLAPVKLNVVIMKETLSGLDTLLDFVRSHEGLSLQLIQYMPERVGHPERGVPMALIHERLAALADDVSRREMHARRVYVIGRARVEVVDPVGNASFCGACQRLRLTARGELKGCLNRTDDLVPIRGLDDEAMRAAFRQVVAERRPFYTSEHVRLRHV